MYKIYENVVVSLCDGRTMYGTVDGYDDVVLALYIKSKGIFKQIPWTMINSVKVLDGNEQN